MEFDLETGANPEDQRCRGPPPEQRNVKAVSVRHCAAATAPRNSCPNCYAEQSHKDSDRSSAVGKQLKQKKSNSLSLAQHHLPALDLFWASFFVRVQLTSLLLISPGLYNHYDCMVAAGLDKNGSGVKQTPSSQGRIITRKTDGLHTWPDGRAGLIWC